MAQKTILLQFLMFDYILLFYIIHFQIHIYFFCFSKKKKKSIEQNCSFQRFFNHLPLHLWPQALHCFIGLGALISPLVVDPFLDETNCTLSADWSANSSLPSDPDSVLFGSTNDITATLDTSQHSNYTTDKLLVNRVSYAFWIMALINVC